MWENHIAGTWVTNHTVHLAPMAACIDPDNRILSTSYVTNAGWRKKTVIAQRPHSRLRDTAFAVTRGTSYIDSYEEATFGPQDSKYLLLKVYTLDNSSTVERKVKYINIDS